MFFKTSNGEIDWTDKDGWYNPKIKEGFRFSNNSKNSDMFRMFIMFIKIAIVALVLFLIYYLYKMSQKVSIKDKRL